MEYIFRETTPEEKVQIMVLLREFGKISHNAFRYFRKLDLICLLETEHFRMTRLSAQPEQEHVLHTFAVFGDHFAGTVTFRVHTDRMCEPDEGGYTTMSDSCELTEQTSEIPADLTEAAVWYVLNSSKARKKLFPEQWELCNVAAAQREMWKEQAFWRSKDIVLAEDFHFTVTTDAERVLLWKTALQYVECCYGYSNVCLTSALTDAKRSFLLTQCLYLSDGIKHCGEPDDYGYLILTPETEGMVMVWNLASTAPKIIQRHGEIPVPDETLLRMIRFYADYCSIWKLYQNYREKHAAEDAARKKAQAALDADLKI